MCHGWSNLYIIAIHLINRIFSFPQMLLCTLGILASPLASIYPSNNSYTITSVFTAIRGTDISLGSKKSILRNNVLTAFIRLINFRFHALT